MSDDGGGNGHYVFLSGAVSGVVEGLSIQPLEMLKTRFQIHTGAPLKVWPTVAELLREGGVLQLYRGALPEITGLIPRASAALATLEFSQRKLRAANGGELSAAGGYLSGCMSGVTEGIVFSPFQVVKVRLMAKEHLGRYRNTWDCLRQIVAGEGVAALATGLCPTLLRNCIWNGLYYGTMHQVQKRLPPLESGSALAEAGRTVAVGTAVGMTATCFNAPFDVVKSRFQSRLPGSGGSEPRRTFPLLAHIYATEGPRALYKGFLPKSLRLGLGQSIGFVVFQGCLRAFGEHSGEGFSDAGGGGGPSTDHVD